MDFLKILRSLEELLYEAITWLFFYPRTLWRILIQPLNMAIYTQEELKKDDVPFKATISPPLFLILTLILLYCFELFTHNQTLMNKDVPVGSIGHMIFGNLQNTLIFRSLTYSIWSLTFALGLLKMQGITIDRESLRAPFFTQCFLIAPFAIGLTLGFIYIVSHIKSLQVFGLAVLLLSLLWYFIVQIRYIQMIVKCSYIYAFIHTLLYFSISCILALFIGYIIINS